MSDPLQRLRHFDPATSAGARSPAEIRQRGDRLRRRRRVITGAAVAAVAAVLVPMTLLIRSDGEVAPAGPGPSSPTAPATPPTATEAPTQPPTQTPDEPGSVPTTIPDDFPLIDGWPDPADVEPGPSTGLTGPQPVLDDPLFDYAACGRSLLVPESAAQLRAIYRNVEDTRTRQLLTFADAQLAVTFMDDLVAFYRACPEEAGGPLAPAYRRAVVPTGVGGQSYAMGGFPPADQPVGSTQVLHAVRLGSAVLLDTTEGEGGGSGDIEALTRQRAELMTASSTTPIGEMCRFAVAGC